MSGTGFNRGRARGRGFALNPRRGGAPRGRGGGNEAFRHGQGNSREQHDLNHDMQNGETSIKKPRDVGNGNQRYPFFGFKKLYGFLNEHPDSVILAIEPRLEEWGEFLETKMVEDILVLLIQVLGEKVISTESVLHQQKVNIVAKTLNDTFCTRCNEKTQKMLMVASDPAMRQPRKETDLVVDHSRTRILRNLHSLFTFVVNKLTTTAIDFVQKTLGGIIGALTVSYPSEEIELLKKDFMGLRDTIASLEEKRRQRETARERVNRRYGFSEREEEFLHGMEPPNDFREVTIVPSRDEIISLEETFLRPIKKYGGYSDADHYLDVQFRLLREDFVKPLKTGIQDFLQHKHDYLTRKRKMPIGNVRIYPDVQILGAELVKDVIIYKVQLPESIYKRVKWEKSKRLLPGSMVVFTSDDFYTAYFGTVAQMDRRCARDMTKGVLEVVWEGINAPYLEQKGEEFLMIECEVYFEAYRHTLQILKEIELKDFPMAKFIVDGSPEVGPPAYLANSTSLLKINDTYISPLQGPWPNATELRLDETQFEAFHSALTKEFAIIQGPPGTGKTFLGLKITEVLLNNLPLWWGENARLGHGPILVVCFTNHALDQFMEGILHLLKDIFPDEDPAMIRVGGRSKSDIMQEYSLVQKRQAAGKLRMYSKEFWRAKMEALDYVRDCEYRRAEIMQEVAVLGNPEGILDITTLKAWDAENTALGEAFQPEIWNLLKEPSQLGMQDTFFESRNFTTEQLLNRWFKLRANPPPPSQNPARPAPNRQQQPAVEDDDDEEDYDLEELLENRLVEEMFLEAEANSTKVSDARTHVKYMNDTSVKDLEKILRDNVIAGAAIGQNSKLPDQDKENQRQQLEKRSRIAQNMKSFLQELFRLYKADLIDLPDVDNILNPRPGDAKPLGNWTYGEKWSLYFVVIERARVFALQLANAEQQRLIGAQKRLKDILNYGDGFLLRQTKIVGMTTTGAAKYNDLLKMMKSKIVIVEEAAEVLEAHIVTSVTEHCQHLILIGDHQQLKPSTVVYELAKKYYLDISLFERMLNNDLHCSKLKVQHRMRPEICDLIVGPIYKELENHASVNDYEPVFGTAKNLFFLCHDQKEQSESDSMSKKNQYEAKFLASLCRFFVQQGYLTSQITILTTYIGQMFLLKKEVGQFPTCKGVRISVVDNFQGEENDIILLSLVRSNDQNTIGFLKIDNRICVAISRAKHGLFICGNMGTLLASGSKTWDQINKKLLARNEIGESLELVCQIHRTSTLVKSSTDFTRVPEGGCSVICATGLKCGHTCESVCHIHDREHEQYKCRQRCERRCKNDHQCQDKCFKDCPPCPVTMFKKLPCGHDKNLACHVKEETVQCREIVLRVLPCGHVEHLPCFQDPQKYKCKIKVDKTLPCAHIKKDVECYEDAASITCKVIVDKILVPCGHTQKAACHQHPEMIKCHTMVTKKFPDCGHTLDVECQFSKKPLYCIAACSIRLDCGHACTKTCHINNDPDHLRYECRKDCGRLCVNGHECSTEHKCSKPCPPCDRPIEKLMSCKIHKTELKCHEDPATVDCLQPCQKVIPRCGHKCKSLCFQPCEPCQIRMEKMSPCGHKLEVLCSEQATQDKCEKMVKPLVRSPCFHETLVPCRLKSSIMRKDIPNYCTHPCGYQFRKNEGGCEHRCAGTCAECMQGRIHIKCQEECARPLVCGHVCKAPCAATSCPPCQQTCVLICEHSACNKICGEPCTGCNEPCNWRCEHKVCRKRCREPCDREPCDVPCGKKLKCGHDCIGFCGEPCPPQCRICDIKELTEFILLGNEDDENARFVLLEDCGHAIEHEALEYHLLCGAGSQNGEILAKTCPRCKTVMRRSRRYGNLLRESLKDVVTVKMKVYGNPAQFKPRMRKIVDELRLNRLWKLELRRVHTFVLDKLIIVIPASPGKGRTECTLEKNVDANMLASLEKIVEHGQDVLKLFQQADTNNLTPSLLETWKIENEKLFKLLIDRVPLNKIEVRDFDREFERLHDLRQVFLRRSSPRFTNGHSIAVPIYERIESIIWSPTVYTKQMKQDVMKYLAELDHSLKTGLGISEREKREILAAIDMAPGRWFKCPNGHTYVIGECGAAMEEARCNECRAQIGGGGHRLRSDNALATEMDGATQPLYPGMV